MTRSTVQTLPLMEALGSLKLPGLERNLFSSPDWLRVLRQTYELKLFIKFIERDNGVSSYLVYSVVKNFLEWKICICSYCDYFDGYIGRAEDWQLFFESLRREYPQYRITVRNLRDRTIDRNVNFSVLSKEKFHILDTRDDLNALWRRTHDSFKSAVKQGERNGIVVRRCDKSALPHFYDLHLKLRKNKYRLFPQPYRFFENIWDEFVAKGRGVLLGAYGPDGTFLGGNFYLIWGNTLYYKFSTSRQASLQLRPNNLLFWEGIKLAKEYQLEYLDMGSSGCHQAGLILFKRHTGAQEQEITHLGFAPEGYKFSKKRCLSLMTRTFTSPWMPDFMVRWGSSLIYPYLA